MRTQTIIGAYGARQFSKGTYSSGTVATDTFLDSPISPYVYQPNDVAITIVNGDTESYVAPNVAPNGIGWVLYQEVYPTGSTNLDRYRIYYKVLTAADLTVAGTWTGPTLYSVGAVNFVIRGTAGINAFPINAVRSTFATGNMSNNATNIVFFDSYNVSNWADLSTLGSGYFTRYDIVWLNEEYQTYNSPSLLSKPTNTTDIVNVGKDSSYLYSYPEKLQVFKHSSEALAAGRYYYTVPVAGQSNITWRYQVISMWLRNGTSGQQMIL